MYFLPQKIKYLFSFHSHISANDKKKEGGHFRYLSLKIRKSTSSGEILDAFLQSLTIKSFMCKINGKPVYFFGWGVRLIRVEADNITI